MKMAARRHVVLLWLVSAVAPSSSFDQGSGCYFKPCIPGWVLYRDHCYRVTPQKLPFNEAETYCQGFANRNGKAHLASVHDEQEDGFILQLALSVIPKEFKWVWIGLTDQKEEGSFMWTDGSAANYTNWRGVEPNDFSGNEDFVAIKFQDGGWNDGVSPKSVMCKMSSVHKPCHG